MSYSETNSVWVVGHKNPDTDSICAAIAYAVEAGGDRTLHHQHICGVAHRAFCLYRLRYRVTGSKLKIAQIHRLRKGQ